jgi:hypothetical protein
MMIAESRDQLPGIPRLNPIPSPNGIAASAKAPRSWRVTGGSARFQAIMPPRTLTALQPALIAIPVGRELRARE